MKRVQAQRSVARKKGAPGRLNGWRIAFERACVMDLGTLARRFGRTRARPAHLHLGERGELEALFFLRRQGYVVVARRWCSQELSGDLDLVAWEGDTLCFIEVKSRSERDQTPAALAIGQAKRRILSQMAREYLRILPRPASLGETEPVLTRFDFVSVYLLDTGTECELLRDAFDWRKDQRSRYGV